MNTPEMTSRETVAVVSNPSPAAVQMVTCKQCNAEFTLHEHVAGTPIGEGVVSYGVTCPACDAYSFIYYETPRIAGARLKLHQAMRQYNEAQGMRKILRQRDLITAQSAFKRVYDDEQRRWRRKRGSLHAEITVEADGAGTS